MFFSAIKRWWAAYKKATTLESRVVLGFFCFLYSGRLPLSMGATLVIYGAVLDSYTTYREYHSPAEQLQTALTFCSLNANGEVTCAEPR